MKKRIAPFMIALIGLFSLAGCKPSDSSSSSEEVKDSYEFVYNVNYEGGTNRTVNVLHGQRVSNWSAKRSGFELDDWYETSELIKVFDFNTAIIKDTTIYAKWSEKAEQIPVLVTFNFNYGNRKPVDVTAYKGQTLAKAMAPDPKRLGYEVEGWYTEKALTNKFVFDSTIVNEALTLYAKYKDISHFNYDANGDIEFSDVSFNLVVNDAFNIGEPFVKSIVDKFNVLNKNKIQANLVPQASTDNSLISLKFHQTNIINRSADYYPMQDVLDLAKIEFDESEFDYLANQDNYKEGKLNSYPVGHITTALVYNKAKLAQYSPAYAADETLPATYEEFYSVMKAFTAGEGTHALITDDDWPFYENGANLPWAQNGIMPYDYNRETNTYYTKWDSAEGKERATSAAQAIYDYFGPNSLVKGTKEGGYDGGFVYDRVSKGTALFALTNNIRTLREANLAGTDVMPVTNLFNKSNSADSRNFVGNYSIAITSSGPNDLYKVAAAGVFADYFSKNATKLGHQGLVPARKSVQNGEFTTVTTSQDTTRLRKAVELDKMITLPGHWYEYTVFNNKDNGNFDLIIDFPEWELAVFSVIIENFADTFKGYIS